LLALPLFVLHLPLFVLVLPFRRVRFGILWTHRLGHLAANTDLYCRRRWLKGSSRSPRDAVFFLVGRAPAANEQLLRMWRRALPVYRMPLMHALVSMSQSLWAKSYFYEPLTMLSNEHAEFSAAPPTLRFTAEEEAQGRAQLERWGIDRDKDWFVCVFARDDAYMQTLYPDEHWAYHDHRNCDIDSYAPAIDEIVARGGFVLRMGYHVVKPLGRVSDRVIDYAVRDRSDFMDIYLLANCRFFLGTSSGVYDVSMIFDRPRVGLNWTPFGTGPLGKDSLSIPKLVECAATGKALSFARILMDFSKRSDPKLYDGKVALEQGYRYIDNTAEEILEVCREMLDRLDGTFSPSEEDEALQRRYFELFPADHWCRAVKSPIGRDFLRRHRHLLIEADHALLSASQAPARSENGAPRCAEALGSAR
jgi:putative glycosyltransferase (TIGR04372 family)